MEIPEYKSRVILLDLTANTHRFFAIHTFHSSRILHHLVRTHGYGTPNARSTVTYEVGSG